MARKHRQLYSVMQASAALPNPTQGQLPPAYLGSPALAISAAEQDTGALLRDIGSNDKYAPLQEMLQGKRPETVLGAFCALAALVKPSIASS